MIESFRGISSGLYELKSGSDLILSSVTAMKSGSEKVQENTIELVTLTKNVDTAMKTVASISNATIIAAKNMRKSSAEVNEVSLLLKDQSNELDEASHEIIVESPIYEGFLRVAVSVIFASPNDVRMVID